jgi:hypothetical protein
MPNLQEISLLDSKIPLNVGDRVIMNPKFSLSDVKGKVHSVHYDADKEYYYYSINWGTDSVPNLVGGNSLGVTEMCYRFPKHILSAGAIVKPNYIEVMF